MAWSTIITAVVIWCNTGALGQGLPDSLQVSTEFGPIQGVYLNASASKVVSAFLGVPFAMPPIGSLRFRAPQDPVPWQSIRLATQNGPSCFQRNDHFFGDFQGAKDNDPKEPPSEDCLYLDIYVPNVVLDRSENSNDDNGLAVMVWFHGGGFGRGAASSQGPNSTWISDPREIAAEGGVIVVSVQYRLGSFGFLFLDTESAPGNVGLLDQQQALGWIKRNIFAFGGDPTRITLAGQDAGGVSAALQLVLEKDANLFQSLILQSAGLEHPWSYVEPTEAFRRTLKLASLLDCPVKGSKENVIDCLRSKSAEDIANRELGVAMPRMNSNPFVITIDGKTIREEPKKLLKRLSLRSQGLKVLIGSNENEGTKPLMYVMPSVFPNKELTEPVISKNDFSDVVDNVYGHYFVQVRDLIKFQYTNWTDQDSDVARFQMMTKLMSDSHWSCPVQDVIDHLSAGAEVFRYLFAVRSLRDVWPRWTGVKQGDELDYVFGRPLAEPKMYEEKDRMVSKFLIHSWAKFIRSGHPSGRGRGKVVGWPKHDPATKYLLHITKRKDIIVDQDQNKEFCSFWSDLIPLVQDRNRLQCAKRQRIRLDEELKYQPLASETSSGKKHQKLTAPLMKEILSSTTNVINLANLRRHGVTTTSTTTTTTSTTTSTTTTKESSDSSLPLVRSNELDLANLDELFKDIQTIKADVEPSPINVLQKKSVISADSSGYKLFDKEQVITSPQVEVQSFNFPPESEIESDPPGDTSKPENQEISYQLNVGNNQSPTFTSPWNLYQPAKPGNSPIYVASEVMQKAKPDLPLDKDYPDFVSLRSGSRPRPYRVSTPFPTSASPKIKDATYDPFNPASYARSGMKKSKFQVDRDSFPLVSAIQSSARMSPYYYPNYIPES